jgi:hypothetical protein
VKNSVRENYMDFLSLLYRLLLQHKPILLLELELFLQNKTKNKSNNLFSNVTPDFKLSVN